MPQWTDKMQVKKDGRKTMNKQFETANITYKGLEDKGLTVTLLDENGKKWTIWKKGYQTDEDSEPYAALHAFTFGDTFGVSYQEKDESFIGKDGKQVNFKRKTIYQIMPTLEQPTAEMKTSKSIQNAPQSTHTDNKVTYQKEVYRPRNFEQEGLDRCLWGYWLSSQERGKDLPTEWKDIVSKAYDEIHDYTAKRYSDPSAIPF